MKKDREHNGKIKPIIKMEKSQLIEIDHINETTTQNSDKIYRKVNMKSVVINIGTSCNDRKRMSSTIGNQFHWCVRNSEKFQNFKISRSQRLIQSTQKRAISKNIVPSYADNYSSLDIETEIDIQYPRISRPWVRFHRDFIPN